MVQARGILFCGGGTGGHIFPGLAVAEVCRRAGVHELRWIGDPGRLEARLVPAAGIDLLPFGLSRPRLLRPLWYLRALRLLLKTWRSMRAQPPLFVVASGGYASLLPGLLAPLLGRPLIVIEPNARPGKTNRLLACFARLAVIQFAEARSFLAAEQVRQYGNPVRPIACHVRGQHRMLRLLVMGGSLSASSINRVMLEALPLLDAEHLQVVHLAGEAEANDVRHAYEQAGIDAEVHSYVDDMPALYDRIDLALCRSGATSVAELCAAGIGALYIPLPWAADDHQTANARAVARVGGALVLPQQTLNGSGLARALNRLLANRDQVQVLGRQAARLARPQAARDIWMHMQRIDGGQHAVA